MEERVDIKYQQAHEDVIPECDDSSSYPPTSSAADLAPDIDTTDADSVASSHFERQYSTTSVNTSVYDFEQESGRTYHSYHKGKYLVPNDADEIDRLALQNHIWYLTLQGRLHLAPFPDSPQRVLDLGTGSGIWAIEFAHKYPSADVLGTDLSPIQPDL